MRFICLPVGTPLPGRPENVAIGTVLPGKANGMIRWYVHSLSLGLWPIQLPRRGSLVNLPLSGEVPRRSGGGTEAAFDTVLPGKAYGIPPYPLTRQGGLFAEAAFGTMLNNGALARQDRRTQFAPTALGQPFCL